MTYVLFRQRGAPFFCCAVPAGTPAPPFIDAQAWAFAGLHTPDQPQTQGFDEAAAQQACREQGFYTFPARWPDGLLWTEPATVNLASQPLSFALHVGTCAGLVMVIVGMILHGLWRASC